VYFKKFTAGRIIPQVLHANCIPGQLSIFVVLCGDADMNNNGGRKRIYPSSGLRATWFSHGRKLCDLKPSTDRARKLICPPTHYLTLCNIINWHIVVKATNRSLCNPQSSHVAVRTPPHRQPVSCNGFTAGKMMKQRKLCDVLHLCPLENWVWQFSFTTVPVIHVWFIDLPFASSRIIYISWSFTGQILSLSATLFHTFWNLTNNYCKTILNI
jgi:hypothetical protein